MRLVLAVTLAVLCVMLVEGVHYDHAEADVDDYDDAWESEDIHVYNKQKHHFKHVKPEDLTEPTPNEAETIATRNVVKCKVEKRSAVMDEYPDNWDTKEEGKEEDSVYEDASDAPVVLLKRSEEDCYNGTDSRMRDYRGTQHTTRGGLECQAWASQSPHKHGMKPEKYPNAGLDANYCRNPNNFGGVWCYTTTSKRWDFCYIKPCPGHFISGLKYKIDKTLTPGDYIEATGIYAKGTSKFSVNIRSDKGYYLLHADFRPSYATVYNSNIRGWGKEVRPGYFPGFQDGKEFKITVVCMDDNYKLYFNDEGISKSLPYRLTIADASYIWFSGGSGKFKWTGLNIVQDKKHPSYALKGVQEAKMEELVETIKKNVDGANLEKVKAYVNSDAGALALFQWRLLKHMEKAEEILDLTDETIKWIFNNREALETFMTSGDADHYLKAVKILAEVIKEDPMAKSGLRLRLAVATGLTFSNNVHSYAVKSNLIDGYKRYFNYVKWAEEKVLFAPFYNLTAWHLRYVVGSWAEDDELVWARANILPAFKSADKVAKAAPAMVKYKLYNDKGVSIHHGSKYYDYKPQTLENVAAIGGVCGAISKFAVAMGQAFGIPGTPVAQPGHCALIWYRNGDWEMYYDYQGWPSSNAHSGIQYTWNRHAAFFPVLNKAQSNTATYRLSEKMRLAAGFAKAADRFLILEDASTECPQNYAVWMDMRSAIAEPTLQKSVVQEVLAHTIEKYRKKKLSEVSDIARYKTITADCAQEAIQNLKDKNRLWRCPNQTAMFEIDFGTPTKINEVKFNWWGWSKASDYDLYAVNVTGQYTLVKTEADEEVVGWFNHWSSLKGWDMVTTKLKVVFRKGRIDPWSKKYYFALRAFQVFGLELDDLSEISTNATVTANKESTGAAGLVDGSSSTVWKSNSADSWFKLQFKQVSVLKKLEFEWAGSVPDSMEITHRVGNITEYVDEIVQGGGAANLNSSKELGTELGVSLEGGEYSLAGVKVMGMSYGTKDILKIKVKIMFGIYGWAEKKMFSNIDEYEYED